MDEDIRRLIADGRPRVGFELLVERYQHKVYRLALSLLREPDRAEDAAQDAFLKIWRALALYDGSAALSTWIYAIARNTILNQLRRDSYRKTEALDGEDPAGVSATGHLTLAMDCDAILSRLPEVSRQVMTLFYMQERSCEEVAEMLGMPVGTVKSHLHRARKQAAEMLMTTGGK